jgi:hypothetical protein
MPHLPLQLCAKRRASSTAWIGGSRSTEYVPQDNVLNLLRCRPSPFKEHNNYGGGFVSDQDRVLLQVGRP